MNEVYCLFFTIRDIERNLINIYINEDVANQVCDRLNKEDESDEFMWYSVEPYTLVE